MADPEVWPTRRAAEHCGLPPALFRDYTRRARNGPKPLTDRRAGDGQNLYIAAEVIAWDDARPGRHLTPAEVEAIRRLVAAGEVQAVVARRYDVSEANVSRIVNASRHRNSRSSTEGDQK